MNEEQLRDLIRQVLREEKLIPRSEGTPAPDGLLSQEDQDRALRDIIRKEVESVLQKKGLLKD